MGDRNAVSNEGKRPDWSRNKTAVSSSAYGAGIAIPVARNYAPDRVGGVSFDGVPEGGMPHNGGGPMNAWGPNPNSPARVLQQKLPPLEVSKASGPRAPPSLPATTPADLPSSQTPPLNPLPPHSSNPQQERLLMERPLGLQSMYSMPPAGNAASHLEPLNMALGMQSRNVAAMEDRIMRLESRVVAAEQHAQDSHRNNDLSSQRMASMVGELGRTASEVNELRARYEGAMGGTAQLQQQVMAMASELRQSELSMGSVKQQLGETQRLNQELRGQVMVLQDEVHRGQAERSAMVQQQMSTMQQSFSQQEGRVRALEQQLGESLQRNVQLEGQVAMLNDGMQRAAADRVQAQQAFERLSRQFAEGAAQIVDENRRAAQEAEAAFRADAQRRQTQYLTDLQSLNREVEGYRSEAQAAGAALHSAVGQLNTRLQAEEAMLNAVQNEAARNAQNEAMALGSMSAQVAELQGVLSSMGAQLQSEQAMRRQEAQAFEATMRNMEQQLQAAQDAAVSRTVQLIETKASNFIRAIRELEDVTAERDEDTRLTAESQTTAVS
jgi:chromosome segregation ATPase